MFTSAIYELDDAGEADGVVHYYCCYSHAEADFEQGVYDTIRISGPSDDNDWIDGTICERCGVLLVGPADPVERACHNSILEEMSIAYPTIEQIWFRYKGNVVLRNSEHRMGSGQVFRVIDGYTDHSGVIHHNELPV